MNALSLFDGMSCGQIALERAGISVDTYIASEVDKYAIKVTQANYPNTIQIGDILNVRGEDLPKIDLLMGGSPCQGFSSSGWKRLNFNDPKSKLFFEYVRILKECRIINPGIKFLFENVRMKQAWRDIITGYLGVAPTRINSSLVSAQRRVRDYWTNISNVTQPENKSILLAAIIEPGYYTDRTKSYCIDANYGRGTNFRRYFFCGSRQLVLENGYSPLNLTKETANEIMHRDGNRWRKLTPSECEHLQTVPKGYTDGVPAGQRYKMLGNGWTVDVIAHIFQGMNYARQLDPPKMA